MPDNFEGTYNYYGKFQFITPSHSLGIEEVEIINDVATAKWGWHFIPRKPDGSLSDEAICPGGVDIKEWYKNHRCILSFDSHEDLTQVVLMIGNRL